jgi:hypothetical protein
MTTNPEDIAAAALQRWLESRKGRGLPPPPDELDADVVEAIYALRPDLAPEPTVTIDEILATLDQAEPLAKWLDDEAEAPDALDDDVAEAIYALQPDRAPGPRVSIDDILGRVTAGPLAQAAATPAGSEERLAEVVPFPSRPVALPEPANVAPPSFAGGPFGQKRDEGRRNTRWLPWVVGSGAFGAVAAAALVALTVLPTAQMSAPDAQMAAPAAPAREEVAANEDGEAAPMMEKAADRPSLEMPADPAPTVAAAPPPAAAPPVVATKSAAPGTGWWEGQQAQGPAKEPATGATSATTAPPPAPQVAFSESSLAGEPPAEEEAVADLFEEAEEDADRDFALATDDDATGGDGLFGGRAEQAAAYDEAPVARGGAKPLAAEAKREKEKKPAATRSYDASNASTPIPAEAYGDVALPADLPPGFASLPASQQQQLLENHRAADALAAQGKPLDAARRIAKNFVAPASVGQWYAAKAARWYQQAGRSDLASAVCDQGESFGPPSAELSAACPAPAPAAAPPAMDALDEGH